MIWRYSKSHKTKRHRQMFVHIYHRVFNRRHDLISCVEPCWAGPDDCQSKGSAILSMWFQRIESFRLRETWCQFQQSTSRCSFRACTTDPRSCHRVHSNREQRQCSCGKVFQIIYLTSLLGPRPTSEIAQTICWVVASKGLPSW